MSNTTAYTIVRPQVHTVMNSDYCEIPCLHVPRMEAGQAEAELRSAPHLAALAEVNLLGAHNCVVLLAETEELGYIGAAYLAARQREVYEALPFPGKPRAAGRGGLLPILSLSCHDTEYCIDEFGEPVTTGEPFAPQSDPFGTVQRSSKRWVSEEGGYPLLIEPEGAWYNLPRDTATQVTRRSLTIVLLPSRLSQNIDDPSFFNNLIEDFRFLCGAQLVTLKKPAAESQYNCDILAGQLAENGVAVENAPYPALLHQLDAFRRKHGGLCNGNICQYAQLLGKNRRTKATVRRLSLQKALAPIELKSQETTQQAVQALAVEIKEQLCGCDNVKKQLESVVDLMQMDCARRKEGLPTSGHGQILLFAGAPGTGKTTAAKLLCDWLTKRELLATECDEHYKQVSGAQLKGAYVGHTAPLVHELFKNSAFLFIDEAYALAEQGQDSDTYAEEAMAQLCIELEKLPEDRVVVFAGYGGKQNRMRAFLDANPGLASRITATVQFDAYSPDKEMPAIFAHHAAARGMTLPEGWQKLVVPYFTRRAAAEDYGSGREARRLLEGCLTAQSHRLTQEGTFDVNALRTLTPADLKAAIHQLETGFAALNTAKAVRCGI